MGATGRAGTDVSGKAAATSLASDVADPNQALVTKSTWTLLACLGWLPDTAHIAVVRTAARWQEWWLAHPHTMTRQYATCSAHVHFGTDPKRAVWCCAVATYRTYSCKILLHCYSASVPARQHDFAEWSARSPAVQLRRCANRCFGVRRLATLDLRDTRIR
jgi:hypothetical protein